MTTTAIKFNVFNVTNGTDSARVWYSLDNRVDRRICVTLYAKDYGHDLQKLFGTSYKNDTDTMTDYFDRGSVTLFEDHEHYAAARARAEANQARDTARRTARRR
jgi:hypothetical protein